MPSTVIHDQASRLREIVLQKIHRPSPQPSRMIAVGSGKGGVGKSTISLNLAVALSTTGKKVLLVDSDHNLGNIATLCGIVPTKTLGDVLRGEYDLTEVLINLFERLDFVAGSSGETDYPLVTEKEIQHVVGLLTNIDRHYDFIILDLAAGISPSIISLAIAANETLVITTDEPTAVMDAYAFIKSIVLLKPHQPINVIVNNVPTIKSADETFKKLRLAVHTFLHRTVDYYGGIPTDKRMQQAIYSQKPLLSIAPHSAAALSIRSCMQRILQHQPVNQREYAL